MLPEKLRSIFAEKVAHLPMHPRWQLRRVVTFSGFQWIARSQSREKFPVARQSRDLDRFSLISAMW